MDDEPAPTAAPTEPPLAGLLGVLREEPGLLGALGRRSTVLVLPDEVMNASAFAACTSENSESAVLLFSVDAPRLPPMPLLALLYCTSWPLPPMVPAAGMNRLAP